jgi:uncharacterized protein (DUF885 family)
MRFFTKTGFGVCASLLAACSRLAAAPAPAAAQPDRMPQVIELYLADVANLERVYPLENLPAGMVRFEKFDRDELATLAALPFDSLSQEDQVDYLSLKNQITAHLHQLDIQKQGLEEMKPLLPFAEPIEQILDDARKRKRPDAEKTAATLTALAKQIAAAEAELAPRAKVPSASASVAQPDAAKPAVNPAIKPVVANRAMQTTAEMTYALKEWYGQYDGYDPIFTWWVEQPYKDVDKALNEYQTFLKQKLVGIAPDDKTTIIGDPVGREALMHQLSDDMIPYTPEELIAIAQTEYDWCMREMLKASREMGTGDDWHAAVEKVKQMHVPPGEQPEMIRKLVIEGSDFVKQHDLVTVPPLADETWRMIMMTPERQLVNPFFTGGDEISVSYPTNTMTYDQREMSMRGNNIPFAHATVFHEMIPGHFLQFYMSARYRPYRQAFETPFWHEGNSLWWEMLLWDKGFDKTPEERVGALVWRMHRSARIIFTMNFHLGNWTPQQCVQSLIDNVGFEPDNATAEVRRSFDGSVGPLYQSAYLLGALQFRALHKELVDSGKMTDRQFHDAILHENSMPIELVRADLENLKLTRDYTTNWKFYGEHPTHP